MPRTGQQEFKRFAQDLGKIPNEVRRELRPVLRRSAQRPLAEARRNAAWSSRIPGATRISVGFSKRNPNVALVVNKNKAPHARPKENQGKPGTFRSPVFGNRDVWVNHRAQPFLFRAAKPWQDDVDNDIGRAIDAVTRKYKFR